MSAVPPAPTSARAISWRRRQRGRRAALFRALINREQAKYKERTYTFLERIGVERIHAVVIDDSDGIAADLVLR
jgi:NAD(P)H-nitrite reductase large subunit